MRNGHRINQQGVCQQRIQCIKDKESPQITRRLMIGNSGESYWLFFCEKTYLIVQCGLYLSKMTQTGKKTSVFKNMCKF